jgi:hypothetical protein
MVSKGLGPMRPRVCAASSISTRPLRRRVRDDLHRMDREYAEVEIGVGVARRGEGNALLPFPTNSHDQ